MGSWSNIAALDQSVWYDNVARPALVDGLLERLVREDGITGGTSNPSIFAKAVTSSNAYDAEIFGASANQSAAAIFERCSVADIQAACHLLRGVWERTGGRDGYISIEEEPALAHDRDGAVRRGHELRDLVDRPNVMIKVPGTAEGVAAFEQLTRDGVSVNVTLLFSRRRYREVIAAYQRGLRARLDAGLPLGAIRSVASFFVSRIDTKVDQQLSPDSPLRGTVAIANARLAYSDVFQPMFATPEWRSLAAEGAHVQRPLWASTGVKDPGLRDTLYVEELIGPDTVTTVPDAALDDFRDHGTARPTLVAGFAKAQRTLAQLAESGIDLEAITRDLEREGIEQFDMAYAQILDAIDQRRAVKAA